MGSGWRRLATGAAVGAIALAACLPRQTPPPQYQLFDVGLGETYGPTLPPPIAIRLGQSILTAHGPVGPEDREEGLAALWEGHALSLNPDRERSRTLYFYVEAEDLKWVSLQINDQPAIVEQNPGVFLSGEFTMVRWAQDYSLKVTAENTDGVTRNAAIYVQGEDARLEGSTGEPLRMRMLRMGDTNVRNLRGLGYTGRLFRHPWPTCGGECDLTTPGGALTAMISGPADTLLLILDRTYPFIAWGLSYWPSPHYTIVAIPVRGETQVDFAAMTREGEIVTGRWDKPPGPEVAEQVGESPQPTG